MNKLCNSMSLNHNDVGGFQFILTLIESSSKLSGLGNMTKTTVRYLYFNLFLMKMSTQ